MTTLCLVDTPQAVAAARRDLPDAVLVTDNPLLAADPKVDGVDNIDRLIDRADTLALGRAALDIAADIDRRLAGADIARRFDLPPDYLILGQLSSRLIASLTYRAAVLARALAHYRPNSVALRIVDAPRWDIFNPVMMARFAHPARALAEQGFFGAGPVDVAIVPAPLPDVINDTAVRDFGRRVAMTPLPQLVFELCHRLGLRPGWAGRVVVAHENEALREAMPWLALAGVAVQRRGVLATPAAGEPVPFDQPATPDAEIRALIEESVRDAVAATGYFDAAQATAIANLVAVHVSAGLADLPGQVARVARRLDAWFPNGGVLLTNGLYGPLGTQTYGLCRARGVRVVEFEHGVTAGLAALTRVKLESQGAPPVERLLVCSDRAARAFNGARGGAREGALARPIGLPDQTRRLLRAPWQRRLARRRLGLGARETVIMHVSTLTYSGNLRAGLGMASESTTFDLDRTLIEEVYPALPHRVVFKQYPTQRFPHEPGYDHLFRLADNISIAKDEDFRYLRAAADVLVTLTPTSTLGWCVGTGAPIVWLASEQINPLADDGLAAAFRDSFPTVDIDRADWPDRLRDILSRGLDDIRAQWRAGSEARARLYGDAITGPAGTTGRRAAREVLDMLGAARPAPVALSERTHEP